jgi:hypothetical protein
MHARRLLATAVAMVAALALMAPAVAQTPPPEGPPTDDPSTAAELGAGFLARQLAEDGSLPDAFSPVGEEIDIALALAAAGVGGEAFDLVSAYILASFEDYIAPADGEGDRTDQPGRIAKLALFADAAGLDATAFGPEQTDLLARIEATRQTSGADEGLYGPVNPFASTITQSYALLAFAAFGVEPDGSAIDWLLEQQCPAGGFKGYRRSLERTAGQCLPEVEGATGTGEGVDQTAFAIQALVAVEADAEDAVADALDFLAAAQNDDGGFGFEPGAETVANSTALVIQALVAADEDPRGEDWTTEAGDPVDALLALQLGCDAPGVARGAFEFFGDPSTFATAQGVWGAALQPFPFGAREVADGAPFPACPLETERVFGANRIATAAEIALDTYPEGTDTVVVAFGFDYADALAGAPLAAAEDAPILLSERTRLSPATAAAIDDLGASRVVLLGGTAALSAAVEQQAEALEGVEEVERVFGPNRFATAAAIAAELDSDTVYVAEGANRDPNRGWPDALAVSALAAFEGSPILLVTAGTLPNETRTALADYDAAVVVGGTSAVSQPVLEAIDAEVEAVDRVFGANRFATARAIADLAIDAGMDPTVTWFATGGGFADALAAGPAVAARGDVLMLVAGASYANSPATAAYVRDYAFTIDVIRAVGGTGAISDATLAALAADAR